MLNPVFTVNELSAFFVIYIFTYYIVCHVDLGFLRSWSFWTNFLYDLYNLLNLSSMPVFFNWFLKKLYPMYPVKDMSVIYYNENILRDRIILFNQSPQPVSNLTVLFNQSPQSVCPVEPVSPTCLSCSTSLPNLTVLFNLSPQSVCSVLLSPQALCPVLPVSPTCLSCFTSLPNLCVTYLPVSLTWAVPTLSVLFNQS